MYPTETKTQPAPPFPAQNMTEPGLESRMDPEPRYEAEDYRPAGKLKGQVALITGGDAGIGRAVGVLYAREGADAGRLHVKLLSQQDFFKVDFIQRGQEAFVFDADFGGAFVFQETEGGPAEAAEVGVGMPFPDS